LIGRRNLLGAASRIGELFTYGPSAPGRGTEFRAEIVIGNVSHSESAIGDESTRTGITKVADPVLHGGLEVNHRRGVIGVMMTTTREIGSTGDEVGMTIPAIPVHRGTVARIENVMIIRAEEADKKCTKSLCRALGNRGLGQNSVPAAACTSTTLIEQMS